MLLFVSRRILGIHQIVSILVFFVHMTARCKLGFAYFVRHRPNCKTNFPTRRWKSMIPHTDEESFISEGDLKINAEPGHVYFVATPIGNSADISERARRLLTSADLICAEDTRNTAQLLKRIKIPFKRLISHHEHNEFKSIDKIRDYALSGQSIVVVSDAGTPGISDPGAPLAAALAQSNIPLHPVPGPSAVIAALSICGYSGDMFTFMGFLPVKGSERQRRISTLVNTQHTVVIYEAPHRVLKTFLDILTAGGDNTKSRQVVCCREITKLHEEIRRGTVTEIYEWLQQIDIAHQVSLFLPKCFPKFQKLRIDELLGRKGDRNSRRIYNCIWTRR